LATGEICFVVGWSGDIMQARSRAAEAKNDIEIGYAIPKEGAQMFSTISRSRPMRRTSLRPTS